MKTENTSTLLGRLLDKMRPSDLLHNEHRLALRSRVESLRVEIGLDGKQFGSRIRMELNDLRAWLSGTKELTLDALTDICGSFHITVGDLLVEQA